MKKAIAGFTLIKLTVVIAGALEKYYDQNGEYPSFRAMTQPSDSGQSCLQFTLKYRDETNGNIVSLQSHH